MSEEDKGKVVLKSVPSGKAEEALIAYLGRLFKQASREKMAAMLRQTPVVLARDIPSRTAEILIANLEKLGATAVYVPEAKIQAGPRTAQTINHPRLPVFSKGEQSIGRSPMHHEASKPKGRRWIRGVGAGLFLVGAAIFIYLRFSGPLPFGGTSEAPGAVAPAAMSRIDFTIPRPISGKTASFKEVAPQDMYAAFAYQYRRRQDRRFLQAFQVLTERWGQICEGEGRVENFRMGVVTSNGKEMYIPLLRNGHVVTKIGLPLPTTFSQLQAALDKWLAAMEKGGMGISFIPVHVKKNDEIYETANQYMDMVDPRYIAMGLSVLEKLWQEGDRDARILKAAARGYAMLLMVLTPDMMQSTDAFAAEALSVLALARRLAPRLSLAREEALLSMNMGYRAHATSLMQGVVQTSAKIEDEVIEAYMRQDLMALRQLRDRGSGILGYYLTARVYREIGLSQEAEVAAWELLQRYPTIYPSLIENIQAGALNAAKILTILYPQDILGHLETQVSPESLEQPDSWLEQLKGFSGDEPTQTIGLSRYEELLKHWSPYEDANAYRFLIDAKRLKRIYRILYADAVYLRFHLLFKRWGVVDRAHSYVTSLSTVDKEHPLVLFMQGLVHAELGKRILAEQMFRQAVRHPRAGGRLVHEAFAELGEWSKVQLLSQAAEQLDGRPSHRLKMGNLFHLSFWDDMAADCYESGLAQNPYQFKAYRALARARGSQEPLLTALERFPDSFQLLEEAGRYFAEKSDNASKEKAAYLLGLAQKLAPSRPLLVRSRVHVLTHLKRYDEALKVLNEWIDRYGRNGLATTIIKVERAYVYLEMGQPEEVLASLGRDVESYQAGAMMVTARAYEELGQIDKAAKQYQKAVARYPTVGHVLVDAAAFFWRQGDDEQAAKMIAQGRPNQGPTGRWYSKDFLDVFQEASDERIYGAVNALQRHGAHPWEFGVYGMGGAFEEIERFDVAFKIFSSLKGGGKVQLLENAVNAYRVLLKWKGRREASEYLRQVVPSEMKGPLMTVLYRKGLAESIPEEMGDPASYPMDVEEFMWLQMLIAWLASDKERANLGDRLKAHYKDPLKTNDHRAQHRISRNYYSIGRYLLGMVSLNGLLGEIRTPKQRGQFAYYIGLAERLKGNFREASQWYHLCRESYFCNTEEFNCASDEIFYWAHRGIEKRHRLLKDDLEAYHNREAQPQIDQLT